MASSKAFVPIFNALLTRPRSNFFNDSYLGNFIRDQLTTEAWLCLGAVIQGVLLYLGGSVTLLPALGLLFYRGLFAFAVSKGWLHNPYMEGAIPKKVAISFPDEVGNYGPKPADNEIVVLLVGTRTNSPLGTLAPGAMQLAKYFKAMSETLDSHREEFDFLGQTTWLNSSDRSTSSENMTVCYFGSIEGLHKFATSKYHRDPWMWWNKNYNQNGHIAIYHETYHVPRGHWEGIFINSHLTGLASTTRKVIDQETGETRWARPLVDASKGVLKTRIGRMKGVEPADE